MELYLFRHGDALSEGTRPLSDRGKNETRRSARALEKLGVIPSLLLHSPLPRANETAQILAEEFELAEDAVRENELLAPRGQREYIVKEVKRLSQSEDDKIFLVGHLPDLGELLTYLVWGEPVKEIPLKKSGVAIIECTLSTLRSGGGTLRGLLTAQHLDLISRSQ